MASIGHEAVAALDENHQEARLRLDEAVDLFERSGLPYEAECARIDLARALARLKRGDAADKHARRAADRPLTLGTLYAAQQAEQASRADPAPGPEDTSPLAALSPRETEVLGLLAKGPTTRPQLLPSPAGPQRAPSPLRRRWPRQVTRVAAVAVSLARRAVNTDRRVGVSWLAAELTQSDASEEAAGPTAEVRPGTERHNG